VKTLKQKLTAFFGAFLVVATLAVAGYTTVLNGSGDPNSVVSAESGTVYTDTASGALWVKTGTTANTGWVAFKTDALGNAIRGTATLSGGTIAITNSAITTNSIAFVNGRGVTNAGSLGVTVANGTLTVNSSSGSDARVVNYLIFNP
jgi:hypothetical protein